MLKSFSLTTCAFDCEWVPCPVTARRLLSLPPGCTDREATEALWRAYAKEGEARPFLKLVLCKVVTIAAVFRVTTAEGEVSLELFSATCDDAGEPHLISSFLERVAGKHWQLWGYNSASADLPILKQRAIALDVPLPKFSKRPAKPWEGMDYHDGRNSDAHIDILELVGGFGGGATKPKLHELAVACGLPGKLDVAGDDVAQMYLDGRVAEIRQYNETDAVTTHLLMLRLAHVGGHLSDEAYRRELAAVEKLVQEQLRAGKTQFEKFWAVWRGAATLEETEGRERGGEEGSVVASGCDLGVQLQVQWKEFLAAIKSDSGVQLAAALNSVRGVSAAGGSVMLHFGKNEFARTMCQTHSQDISRVLAQVLGSPGIQVDYLLGEPDASGELRPSSVRNGAR